MVAPRPVIHHIPVCPFSQRVEILLELKGCRDAAAFDVIDITRPRPDWLLQKTGGTTALPVMDLGGGRVLKESMVLLRYAEEALPGPAVARTDPYERGVERLMATREGPFAMSGYLFVMNRDRAKTAEKREALLEHYRWLSAFLDRHNPEGTYLFDSFGLAEAIYTPMMARFWFLDYYEGFDLPETADYARVRRWRDACLSHPAAQQVSYERIVKLYYDYAVGCGNGALPEGRRVSSFTFDPDWRDRPMPPRDKYDRIAGDAELGLV
ncbi:glutathione S-transferase family protein [Psychromarinibacter sp. C21-152]|uniref:Glutathione S-transferase family protein n=1 Tax=Psychromarinibacter sediminicola TaxID=3033385 RepID=A0AAE3TAN2_9RHOB|nr:glutathione S-transferase family protein [Psychromarinibacter sediminicola]MDF0601795.1 glutathione S-transferase family protein [Psychromarinibacter sediminicola]